jgi:hypothetical protein
MNAGMNTSAAMPVKHSRHRFVDIVMGLVILVLGGGITVLGIKNSTLAKQMGLLTDNQGANSSQVTMLTTENSGLKATNDALSKDNADLLSQLGIFVSSRLSGEEQLDISGTLMLGGNGTSTATTPYILKTSKGIMLTLKNSRAANVDSVLKPLMNQEVKLRVTHVVNGGKDLTILAINDTPIAP